MSERPNAEGHRDATKARPLPSEVKPERGAEHEKLAIFVGDWRGKGTGGGTPMTTRESYDWIEGKYFLQVRFDQEIARSSHIGLGILGYDSAAKAYRAQLADNLGYLRDYEVRADSGDVWRFLGERERATVTFKDGRMNVRWEHRPDGGDWAPLCEFDAINERAPPPH